MKHSQLHFGQHAVVMQWLALSHTVHGSWVLSTFSGFRLPASSLRSKSGTLNFLEVCVSVNCVDLGFVAL